MSQLYRYQTNNIVFYLSKSADKFIRATDKKTEQRILSYIADRIKYEKKLQSPKYFRLKGNYKGMVVYKLLSSSGASIRIFREEKNIENISQGVIISDIKSREDSYRLF